MAKETILIIDGSPRNTEYLTENILEPNGYRALVANNGTSGLKLVETGRPELVILSLQLPDTSGVELLRALQQEQVPIPVIILGAQGSEMLPVEAVRLGVRDYIPASVAPNDALDAIGRALAPTRLRRERDELEKRLAATGRNLERRVRELSTLFGTGKSATSIFDERRLLARLVEAGVYLTHSETGSLLFLNETGTELYLAAARGIDDRFVHSIRLPVKDSLAGEVLTSGQPVILSGKALEGVGIPYPVCSLIYVPLKIKGRVHGVLGVDIQHDGREFTNHDLRLLSMLADFAALWLENAQLSNRLEAEMFKLTTVLVEIDEPVVIVAGQDHRIVAANAAFEEISGNQGETITGSTLEDVDCGVALLELVAAADTWGRFRGEIRVGDDRTYYVSVIPVPNVGQAIIMKDVTHLRELNQIKSEFVSAVSHELRLPLDSTREYVNMLARVGPLTSRQQLIVERIHAGVGHLAGLVDKLLDLGRLELGIDPDMILVDLGDLAAQVIADFQERASKSQLNLIYHRPEVRVYVEGNRQRLRQVMISLLDNAFKNTPRGGRVAVIIRQTDTVVVCKVEDTGTGIPPGDLPFVFDKFFRIKTRPNHSGSSGLGLAICKTIVQKHGGHIWAESRGGGSTLTFSLPRLTIEDELLNAITELAEVSAAA